jgi:hypothetical protein
MGLCDLGFAVAQHPEQWNALNGTITGSVVIAGLLDVFLGWQLMALSLRWQRRLSSGEEITDAVGRLLRSHSADTNLNLRDVVAVCTKSLVALVLTLVLVACLERDPIDLCERLLRAGILIFASRVAVILAVTVFIAYLPSMLIYGQIVSLADSSQRRRQRRKEKAVHPSNPIQLTSTESFAVRLVHPTWGIRLTFWGCVLLGALFITQWWLRDRFALGHDRAVVASAAAFNSGTSLADIFTGAWHMLDTICMTAAVFWTVVSLWQLVRMARESRAQKSGPGKTVETAASADASARDTQVNTSAG